MCCLSQLNCPRRSCRREAPTQHKTVGDAQEAQISFRVYASRKRKRNYWPASRKGRDHTIVNPAPILPDRENSFRISILIDDYAKPGEHHLIGGQITPRDLFRRIGIVWVIRRI